MNDIRVAAGMSYRVVDEAGHLGVSGPSAARELTGLRGTYYNPSVVSQTVGRSALASGFSRSNVLTTIGASVAINAWDYGIACERETGIRSSEFVASTSVDIGTGLLAGAAAAAVTALVVVTAPVSIPAVVVAAGLVGLAVLFGIGIDATGVPDDAKRRLNSFLEASGLP